MAARHLKRLGKDAVLEKVAAEEDDDSSAEADLAETKPFNPFDLLTDSEREEQDEEAPASEQADTAEPNATHGSAPATSTKQSKKSKQKKKKGKKPGQSRDHEDVSEGPSADKQELQANEEDLDAILEQFRALHGGSTVGCAAGPSLASAPQPSREAFKQSTPLLAVDVKLLQGDNELREIFGADVIEAVDRQDTADLRRRGRAAQPRGTGRGRRPLKRSILVVPRDHWPPLYDGLSMEYVGMKDGRQLFRYIHPPGYQAQQAAFDECQASHDPNSVAALLQRCPYHVDALLTMYELYRHMGENQYAEEILARALYALEMGWHPNFAPATGACLLDFEVPENRALFTALFRHMQALTRQGLHRSALEVCKLLLGLDPEDPLGTLMYIDYIALRAGKYDYLQRFVTEFASDTSLHLLPNFAFSLALARSRQEEQRRALAGAATSRASAAVGSRRSGGAAAAGDETADGEGSADDQLLQAALLHPLTVVQLVSKLQSQGACKESIWTSLMARKLYASASDGGSASLSHLVGLFVERSHLLWKAPEAQAFLLKACQAAADIADKKVQHHGPSAADWAAVRAEAFPPTPGNEFRHLRLAEFSDAVNALPREELQAAMAAGGREDFEAALAEVQEQVLLAQQQAEQRQQGGAPPVSAEELQNTHPLMMLLRSMLPWVNAGEQPDYAREGQQAAAAAAAAPAQLQQPQAAAAQLQHPQPPAGQQQQPQPPAGQQQQPQLPAGQQQQPQQPQQPHPE